MAIGNVCMKPEGFRLPGRVGARVSLVALAVELAERYDVRKPVGRAWPSGGKTVPGLVRLKLSGEVGVSRGKLIPKPV
jgi:hypothetical protein